MTDEVQQLERHIAVLEEFEQKYGEYLVADHNRRLEGRSDWSSRQWAERSRELRQLAPRADAAIDASGVGGVAVYWPPALGGGLLADDLASLMFEAREDAYGNEGPDEEVRQAILDRLPSQIEGLKMQLEEVEANQPRQRRRLPKPRIPKWRWLHEPNPWVLGIGAAVIAGLIVLAVWAAVIGHT